MFAMALLSQLLGSDPRLTVVANGGARLLAPEVSDSVARVQQALVALGSPLSVGGIDDVFGAETGAAVVQYKSEHGLMPSDPVVGVGTSTQLDLEIAYLEGTDRPEPLAKTGVLALDPYRAGFFEHSLGDLGIGQRVLDFFELRDKICFRLSLAISGEAAQWFSEVFVEPKVFDDFRATMGPITANDFFDASKSNVPYRNFLLSQHPDKDPVALDQVGQRTRPDILRHRPAGRSEWYEIKPASIAGAVGAWKKFRELPRLYASVGLPYEPGTLYTPTQEILIQSFITPQGGKLDVIAEVWRSAPGLIFWTFCLKGDYVQYLNNVRLVAGLLAILAALAELAPAAAEAAPILAEIAEIAAGLGVIPPLLQLAP
jgi:hypothetical protein